MMPGKVRPLGAAMIRWIATFLLALLLLPAVPRPAEAKMAKTFTYRYKVIWSTVIRFIRADKSYKVGDKDKENGYILFTFPGRGAVKECSATMELFPIVDQDGYKRIQVKLRIAHQPSYIELHLLDELEKKLGDEQGDPPPAQKAPQKKPKRAEPPAGKEKGHQPPRGKRR
jgi:hypothetical protein